MEFQVLLDFILEVWGYLSTFGQRIISFVGVDLADTGLKPFLDIFGVQSLSVLELLFGALITTFFTYTFTKWVMPM